MKTRIHSLLIAFSCLASVCEVAGQGTAFTYQGRLNDGGSPANGSYDLQFAIYNASTNGNQIGPSLTNAATAVSNGLFDVTLDFGGVFNGSNDWLQIAVRTNGGGAFITLNPLQPITPAPYAIFANTAGNLTGVISAAQLPPTAVVNSNAGVTLGGIFTGDFSGIFDGDGNGLTNFNGANLVSASVTPDKLSATFGYFFLVNPPDAGIPIAPGTAVPFPRSGPVNGIIRLNSTDFTLEAIGVYEVTWQVGVSQAGQLDLAVNNVEQPQTVVGRATGTTQIMGDVLIQTISPNAVLEVRNPAGNTIPLTITPEAGGNLNVTGSLVIKRLR